MPRFTLNLEGAAFFLFSTAITISVIPTVRTAVSAVPGGGISLPLRVSA
jgi:hypothetical protein